MGMSLNSPHARGSSLYHPAQGLQATDHYELKLPFPCNSLHFHERPRIRAFRLVSHALADPRSITERPSVRQRVQTRAMFSRRGGDVGTTSRKEGEDEGSNGKPPSLPPQPWEMEGEEVEDRTPYIPEVNDQVSIKEEILKELSSKGATAIKVENVTKTFVTRAVGARTVVRDVSINVEPGQLVALVGTSGSGKTTLMRMVAGLEPATAGKIYFDGQDMSHVAVQDRDVGVLFQSYALFKHMTVLQNITYGLRTRKRRSEFPADKVRKRGEDLLELVQLTGLGDRYPPQLSGGQRQRVALARALCTQPRVLLLDEPFGALDAIVRLELRSWVRKLQRALQITTIMVTHDQEEALEMADLMIVFHRGRIVQMGPPFEVLARPNSPFVMNFMCDPTILQASSLAVRRSGLRTSKPYVLVRPDDAVIFLEEHRELNTTPATVTSVLNMGQEVEMEISYDDGEKLEFIRQRYDWEDRPYETGQRLHLQLKPMLLMPCTLEDLKA